MIGVEQQMHKAVILDREQEQKELREKEEREAKLKAEMEAALQEEETKNA